MKKLSLIFGLALGMLTVSCSQDFNDDVAPVVGDTVTLGVTLDEGDVRTSLGALVGEKYSVLWSAGDKLAVNGVTSSAVLDTQVGTTYGQFTVEGVKAPYEVLYPAEALNADGTITIATEQVYTPGSFANGNAVLVGYSTDGVVAAKHLYSFVKINVVKGTEDVALKSVTVKALGGEAISGTFEVDYQNATITPAAGQDLVRVSSAEGVAIGDGVTFVAAIPAGNYSAGFEVTVADVNGKGMTRKATHADYSSIQGGMLLDMPALTYAAEVPVSTATPITTAEQLQAFLNAATAGDISAYVMDNGEVVLGSDIDLTGVTLTPAATFTGVFNGQGYALKNWTSNGGLITANSGTIKNLVIDASCTPSYGTPAAAGVGYGVFTDTNTGSIIGCINNANVAWNNNNTDLAYQVKSGVFAGINSGTISHCVNNGDVTLTLTAIDNTSTSETCTQYHGAMIGTGTGQTITNCINNGNMSVVVAGVIKHSTYVGGIAAGATSGGTVSKNINNGKVHISAGGDYSGGGLQVAGIVSYTSADLSECTNNGDVDVQMTGKVLAPQIGGVVGYTSGNVDECHNTGKVSLVAGYGDSSKGATASDKMTGGKKATMPEIAGVLALGYKSQITNSSNSGHVYVEYTNPAGESAANMVRTYVGGVAATIMGGKVDKCDNHGRVETIISTGDQSALLKQVYMGGVFCNGYNNNEYPVATYPELTTTPISNCNNYGELYFNVDHFGSNNYLGGVFATIDGEGETTTEATNCTNYGNIYDLGYGKTRIGGVSGGAAKMTNCINHGDISVSKAGNKAQVGGVVGFHTFHPITNCENYGKVVSTSEYEVYCGGLIGQISAKDFATTGCKVVCDVACAKGGAGIISGYTTATNTNTITVAASVSGSVTKPGAEKVTLTADNYTQYLLDVAKNADHGVTFDVTLLTE